MRGVVAGSDDLIDTLIDRAMRELRENVAAGRQVNRHALTTYFEAAMLAGRNAELAELTTIADGLPPYDPLAGAIHNFDPGTARRSVRYRPPSPAAVDADHPPYDHAAVLLARSARRPSRCSLRLRAVRTKALASAVRRVRIGAHCLDTSPDAGLRRRGSLSRTSPTEQDVRAVPGAADGGVPRVGRAGASPIGVGHRGAIRKPWLPGGGHCPCQSAAMARLSVLRFMRRDRARKRDITGSLSVFISIVVEIGCRGEEITSSLPHRTADKTPGFRPGAVSILEHLHHARGVRRRSSDYRRERS